MKVLIVGGSVAGLSAAVALRKEGLDVVVLERAGKIGAVGAGLELDPITCEMLYDLGFVKEVEEISRPTSVEEYRVVNHKEPLPTRRAVPIIANEMHNHRSFLWSDLHRMLFESLPEGTVRFGHKVTSFEQAPGGLKVTAGKQDGSDPKEFRADFLVAADGSNSTIRKIMRPEDKARYAGMIAWRGVVKGDEHPELVKRLQADYKNLEQGAIFDLSTYGGMNLIYMLPGNRINWLWYRDAPEPKLSGHSVTMKASQSDLVALHKDAEATWTSSLVDLIKATEIPFINAIFDRDPIDSWTDGEIEERVVLLGEAAHPTTPHGSRSTNMSLQDSYTLGQCYKKCKGINFVACYQKARVLQTAEEVLFSRYVGELRQGRWVDTETFGWPERSEPVRRLLLNALSVQSDYLGNATMQIGIDRELRRFELQNRLNLGG